MLHAVLDKGADGSGNGPGTRLREYFAFYIAKADCCPRHSTTLVPWFYDPHSQCWCKSAAAFTAFTLRKSVLSLLGTPEIRFPEILHKHVPEKKALSLFLKKGYNSLARY